MGRDNGSGMLSAHAGDASAFVQRTCVVGTRPLLSRAGQALAAERLLVHLSLCPRSRQGFSTLEGGPQVWPSQRSHSRR